MKDEKRLNKLISEIHTCAGPKLFNIEHGTASERERQIVCECLGFLSLIQFSMLGINEIVKLWEDSNLAYM